MFLKNVAVAAAVFVTLWNLDERVLFPYDAGLSWVWPIWEYSVFALTFGGFLWANCQMFPQITHRTGRIALCVLFSFAFSAALLMTIAKGRFEREEKALWDAVWQDAPRLFPNQFRRTPGGQVVVVKREPNHGLHAISNSAPSAPLETHAP